MLPLTELQPSPPPNYIYLRIVGMGFQMEEILKQIKVGLDPQKSLAKMNENRDVENRVRGQVMHLNPPMEKEAPEEIGNRKTEAPKNIRKENNRFVSFLMGKRFPHRSTPMDHASRLKKMTLHQIQKMGVGTLTRLPLLDLRPVPCNTASLPFRNRFLRRHGNREKQIPSCFTLGV